MSKKKKNKKGYETRFFPSMFFLFFFFFHLKQEKTRLTKTSDMALRMFYFQSLPYSCDIHLIEHISFSALPFV